MSIKRNYLFNTLFQITNVFYPLITFPYVSKVIGPAGIGKFSFIMSLVQYYIIFAALGISAYGVREIARLRNDKLKRDRLFNELITINAINSVICSVVYLLMFFLIPKLYNDINYFLISTIFILFSFTNVDWFFAGIEEFKLITLRNFIVKICTIVLLFAFVKSEKDFIYYFSFSFLGLFVNNFINFFYLRNEIKFSFVINFKTHYKPLFLLFATIFATSIYNLMDTIILGFLTNISYVGFYNVSLKLYQVCIPIVTGMGLVMLPKMANALHRNDMIEYNNLIRKSISFHFFLSFPISLFICLFSKDLILLFADERYLDAVLSTQILAPLIVVVGFANILILQILNTMRLEKFMLLAVLGGAVTSLVFNFLLVPVYQHIGSAIATSLTELVVCLSLIYYVFRKTTIRYNLKTILHNCLSLIPFYLVYLFFYESIENVFIRLGLITAVGFVLYIIIMHIVFKNEFIKLIYNDLIARIK
jgi:O-antigen/teichoic acid export membrane protein